MHQAGELASRTRRWQTVMPSIDARAAAEIQAAAAPAAGSRQGASQEQDPIEDEDERLGRVPLESFDRGTASGEPSRDEVSRPLLQHGPTRARADGPSPACSDGVLSGVSMLLRSLVARFDALAFAVQGTPKQVAKEIPRALHEHEAARLARQELSDEQTLVARIKLCRSVPELTRVDGIDLVANYSDQILICLCCHKFTLQGSAVGIWTLRQDFPHLKAAVADHVASSSTHKDALRHFAIASKTADTNITAARNCARLVLKVVHEHQSYLAYEREVALAHACGLEVGTLNHSADFASKFIKSMHAVVIATIHTVLTTRDEAIGRRPPFAVVADKATIGRQTGQMVGIVSFDAGARRLLERPQALR
mmetsp:Transcript_19237/g.56688  ORF Transcript_19237/g.56688 Transcript_19237/m.56688 type:complete len:366 (+) Transcript_19237:119-1216(+)